MKIKQGSTVRLKKHKRTATVAYMLPELKWWEGEA